MNIPKDTTYMFIGVKNPPITFLCEVSQLTHLFTSVRLVNISPAATVINYLTRRNSDQSSYVTRPSVQGIINIYIKILTSCSGSS